MVGSKRTPPESRSTGHTESLSSLTVGSMSLGKIPFFFSFSLVLKGNRCWDLDLGFTFLALDPDEDPEFT